MSRRAVAVALVAGAVLAVGVAGPSGLPDAVRGGAGVAAAFVLPAILMAHATRCRWHVAGSGALGAGIVLVLVFWLVAALVETGAQLTGGVRDFTEVVLGGALCGALAWAAEGGRRPPETST